jgi:hypothetical protein
VALLSTQAIPTTGVAPSLSAAAGGGDTAVPGTNVFLYVNNGGGSPITVTLVTPETVDSDLAVGDREVTVTNGTAKFIKLDSNYYRNPSTGLANITYSGVTTVTVGVFSI